MTNAPGRLLLAFNNLRESFRISSLTISWFDRPTDAKSAVRDC
jgi:hypothetical protein